MVSSLPWDILMFCTTKNVFKAENFDFFQSNSNFSCSSFLENLFYLKSVKFFGLKDYRLIRLILSMILLYCFYSYIFLFGSDLFLFWFVQKRLVLQVKELSITGIKVHEGFAQIVTKSISNVGNLKLSKCKITKPALEELRTALKDKLVSKI